MINNNNLYPKKIFLTEGRTTIIEHDLIMKTFMRFYLSEVILVASPKMYRSPELWEKLKKL